MKKTIKDLDLKGKKVIIRCDFNVPIKNGRITDDNRIKESLRTIKYAIRHSAKIILISHLGRVKTLEDKDKYSLKPVALRLSELLNRKVIFVDDYKGKKVENAIDKMKNRSVVLLENTRFADLDGNKESGNDKALGKYWASLGDIFINEAFGTAHRSHASNVGIASNLPSAIGFLMEKEIKFLSLKIKRPYTVVLGGAKVSDKIGVINALAAKADYVLIGGAMAFTFLKASGFNVGGSLVQTDEIDYCYDVLNKYEDKIVLPIDVVTAKEIKSGVKTNLRFVNEIEEDEIGLDIGRGTIKVFKQYLDDSKTIFWNGPVGYFELSEFSLGTKMLLDIVSKTSATTIIGGGDTGSAAINMGYQDKITHISTGGGASLKYLEGKELPGIDVIDEK
ncbi:MAG: phosphoglycerate kinase [Bacilli bacterium]|nr:phosphoglycerate kinase [Bacilli bacterium]